MRTEKKIPELRFPEFEGEWQQNTLGEIATILKGKGISKNDICENGNSECILYGELYTHYTEVIKNIKSKTNLDHKTLVFSKSNDVIIPSSGETQIDIATASCVTKDGVAFGGDLNIIRGNANGVFLSFYLNNKKKKDIAQLAQGISVVHLYGSQLKSLLLKLPTLPEQQKIASFLSAADQRIHLLTQKKEKLEQYKKGIMQQIFSQQLRFKDENGKDYPDWEEKRLGELGHTYNGLTGKTKEDFGDGKPYIQYMQIFKDSKINIEQCDYVRINDKENQNTVKFGDIFFTISSETPNEIGTASVLLDKVEGYYLNSFCFGYRPIDLDKLCPDFSRFFFRSEHVRRMIVKLAQGSTRYNMSKGELMKLSFFFPCISEQKKIASFLSSIDNKIVLVNQQIELTRKWKQGLLQKMFV